MQNTNSVFLVKFLRNTCKSDHFYWSCRLEITLMKNQRHRRWRNRCFWRHTWRSTRVCTGCTSHISYFLGASSKRPNDFSLIGKKPNETLQFTWKNLWYLKFKSKLNSKLILKGRKSKKKTKGSKNRRGYTQVKAIFLHINKQEMSIYCNNKVIHAKKYCFRMCCMLWVSYWHIECKINWERTFIKAAPFIEMTGSFWDSIKTFKRSHQRQSRNQKFQAGEVSGN